MEVYPTPLNIITMVPHTHTPHAWRMLLFGVVALVLDLFDFEILPTQYDSSEHWHCRAYHTVFNQGDCGACLAFAVATAYGMSSCVDGRDELPSPHRIFDCSGGTCESGTNLLAAYRIMKAGVPDINSTAPMYGMGCAAGPYRSYMDVYVGKQNIKRALMRHGALVYSVDMQPYLDMPEEQVATHAVVVTGWGSEPKPHWIIQNSWSEDWGRKGKGVVAMESASFMIGISPAGHWLKEWFFWK